MGALLPAADKGKGGAKGRGAKKGRGGKGVEEEVIEVVGVKNGGGCMLYTALN